MIDIHSHILPGVDDGSKKISITLDMVKRASLDGTTDIVATPHYRKGYFYVPYKEVKEIATNFNKLVKEEGLNCNIHYGQEVYYSESIIEDLESGEIGTINDGQYMLIEFPMRRIPEEAIDYMYELKLRGITPIIAHPERYKEFMNDITKINDFINEGCLFQMNAGSMLGEFGSEVKKCAEKIIKNRIYNFIGSDAHNDTTRKTGISDTIYTIFKMDKCLEENIRESSRRLLNNDYVEVIGEKVKKKKLFYIFR
ncbi:CpsB/CapC family capsule biosynthesis tyrosine phosphatase [Clostridium baratii]|uniref:tyrosine-protein phosphatase n=1 Tax=Clostridium baratii TaxID=1561 RepID=UPI002A74748C|nr:CpsB/CapC family capsule biosynthesis tyrosine phosphatase [Clostridium baratii]MDY3207547.1 CpsB/CapC family capsule biosynthesis tyrosine phosphatase [Clostridium baratii]